MKNLIEAQNKYIEEMNRFKDKAVRLLTAAKISLGNHIGKCNVMGCTAENPCNTCNGWVRMWDEIDEFIKADT